jgi:hypothetical protein
MAPDTCWGNSESIRQLDSSGRTVFKDGAGDNLSSPEFIVFHNDSVA